MLSDSRGLLEGKWGKNERTGEYGVCSKIGVREYEEPSNFCTKLYLQFERELAETDIRAQIQQ
jgi:hypothetical protein